MNRFYFFCPYCGQRIETETNSIGLDVVCPSCNRTFNCQNCTPFEGAASGGGVDIGGIASKLSGKFSEVTRTEKLEGFSLKALFSEVFSKHTDEEVEGYFSVGTATTTPSLESIDTSWPRPWVFFKLLFGSIVVYLLLHLGWNQFRNVNLLPGMMLIGSFAVPFSALVFFMEVNVARNISLYQVIRCVMYGGVGSLIISFILSSLPGMQSFNWLGASIAGITEEPAKLIAVLLVPGTSKYKYKLNGLLLGAAVGTGFAAFESAGYAFTYLLRSEDPAFMENVIFVRGMLAPFMHIIWTAITAAALWRVKGERKFSFEMLSDKRFWCLALVPVLLHMIWNSPLSLPFFGKFIILGFIGWFVVLSLLQEGLKELRALKKSKVEKL